MGMIARVIKCAAEKWVTLTGETVKDFNINTLLYTPAGDDSVPLPDERLVLVKVIGAGKYAAVGVLTPSQGAKPGEKILFSRNGNGKTVGKFSLLNNGAVKLEAERDFVQEIKGKFYMGNGTQNMAKLIIGLIDEIINLETFGPPPKHKVMPVTIAKLEAYKNQVRALLGEGNDGDTE